MSNSNFVEASKSSQLSSNNLLIQTANLLPDSQTNLNRPSAEDTTDDKIREKKLPRRVRARQHCAKFWLWYLIAIIILLAILLPLL